MSLLGMDIPQQPDRDARNKRRDLKDKIQGVQKHPVERKEKLKPHPDEPREEHINSINL